MAEMKRPERFPVSLMRAGPFLFAVYSVVSILGYGYLGAETPANVMMAMQDGGWRKPLAFLLLLIHMLISFVITSQVLLRFVHTSLQPSISIVNGSGWQTVIEWAGLSLVALLWSFVSSQGPFRCILSAIAPHLLLAQ